MSRRIDPDRWRRRRQADEQFRRARRRAPGPLVVNVVWPRVALRFDPPPSAEAMLLAMRQHVANYRLLRRS